MAKAISQLLVFLPLTYLTHSILILLFFIEILLLKFDFKFKPLLEAHNLYYASLR